MYMLPNFIFMEMGRPSPVLLKYKYVEFAELTASICHIVKSIIIDFTEIGDNKFLEPISKPLLIFGHRGNDVHA